MLMQPLLNFSKRPVVLAIALALLLHLTLLFGPNLIQLAPVEISLPPLTARLEPLPAVKLAAKPKPVHKPEPRAHTKPKPVAPTPSLPHEPEATPAEVTPAEVSPAEPAPVEAAPAAEEAKPAHPLPRHAQLTFIAYLGTSFPVGEVRHRLDVNDDKSYNLQVGMNTTGVARIFKTFELSQQSTGTITAGGIRPDRFIENKLTSKGKQILSADFDWQNRQLNFSNGNSSPLPDQAQDILSFLYQFSQIPLDQATLSISVSNGKKLESYQLEVGSEEEIKTPLGKLRALPLRKINAPGEEGLEIWLGLEYRLLPVKIRSIDKKGETAGELDISDIRVSEE